MKLLRVGPPGSEVPAVRAEDGRVFALSGLTRDIDGAFLGSGGIERVRAALEGDALPLLDVEHLRVGAPVARPGKVVCVGLNYRDHAEETGAEVPARPVIFMKDPSTVVGPYDQVLIPRGSVKTDWEVELAVVIGREARYLVDPADAARHIAGYAISNDVSEREFQLEYSAQWDLGKSCETFNPLGPWLVTPDEVGDPQALGLLLDVNGVPRQHGHSKNMIFDVAHVVWYLSQYMVLRPGDVINTGTPAGVALGLPSNPYRPRDEYTVASKVGRCLGPVAYDGGDDLANGYAVPATHRRRWDFTADGVRRSLESRLERLGLDRIDIVHLHDPDEHFAEALDQAYPALERLRAEGAVGAIGVGMNQSEMLTRFVRDTDIDAVLLAGRYTLLDQGAAAELLPEAARRGVSVIVGGVFNSGLLADRIFALAC